MSEQEKRETHADIIAEMGRDADGYTHPSIVATKLNYYADRLEAAHERELEEVLKQEGGSNGN